jgi:translocator protein
MRSRALAIGQLLVFLGLVAAAASVGALFKPGVWYAGLAKPAWTPPNAVFAPVWSALYLMIAVAGWLVWRGERPWPAIGAWALGLALNMAWSWLFFDRHLIGAALVDILALWGSIISFLLAAQRANRAAFWLFVPYLLWVGVAAALNLQIWRLNY